MEKQEDVLSIMDNESVYLENHFNIQNINRIYDMQSLAAASAQQQINHSRI